MFSTLQNVLGVRHTFLVLALSLASLKAGRPSAVALASSLASAHSLEIALREKLFVCLQTRSERVSGLSAEGLASVLASPTGHQDWVKPVPLRGHVGFKHARAWLDRFSQFLDPLRVLGNLPTYCVRGYSPTTTTKLPKLLIKIIIR